MRIKPYTFIKRLACAGLIFYFGPIILKHIIENDFTKKGKEKLSAKDTGMPVDPVQLAKDKIQDSNELKRVEQPPLLHSKIQNLQPAQLLDQSQQDLEKEAHAIKDQEIDEKVVQPFEAAAVRIDWHDYKAIETELNRTGRGEQGKGIKLTEEEKKERNTASGFSGVASEKISVDRAIKDIRHHDCRSRKYLEILLTASVIIPIRNEHWITLIRSIHSILNRAPEHLLKEIILVDDFSTVEHLGKQLDDHVRTNYDGKVKVVRATKREGLIRAKNLGAAAATGQVLIFLDSHIECNINWLPPLLEPIAINHQTVVCPFIDVIDYTTFEYRRQDNGARGAFDWQLYYKRLPRLKEDQLNPAEPFRSPVMAGGLFAIHQEWFWKLGGYDPGLEIWGGEQYELSFKIWQCGGTMVDAPCSRIGHIYRNGGGFGSGSALAKNYRRVAVVWMDEYAEYIYQRRPTYRNIDPGDLTAQKELRQKLNCKSFKWFMTEIAFDLEKYYPSVEPLNIAKGLFKNVASDLCIENRMRQKTVGINTCKGSQDQKFEFTWHSDIRPVLQSTMCFDGNGHLQSKLMVKLWNCHGRRGPQLFKYNLKTQQIYHPSSNKCLSADMELKELYLLDCNENQSEQKWTLENLNSKVAEKEWVAKE